MNPNIDEDHTSEEAEWIKILRQHFPNQELSKGDMNPFLMKQWFLAGGHVPAVVHATEIAKLKRLEKAVTEVWVAYDELDLQTKRAMIVGKGGSEEFLLPEVGSLPTSPYAGLPEHERIRHNLQRELAHLHRAVHGRFPTRLEKSLGSSRDRGMIQQGLNGLERTQSLSSDKVSTATRQKIRLVGEARRLWKQYKHKDAPRKGETKFSSFLGDILKFVGKSGARGWSTFRVMEVWAEHEQAHTKKSGGEIR